jgi:hypothetical protein
MGSSRLKPFKYLRSLLIVQHICLASLIDYQSQNYFPLSFCYIKDGECLLALFPNTTSWYVSPAQVKKQVVTHVF